MKPAVTRVGRSLERGWGRKDGCVMRARVRTHVLKKKLHSGEGRSEARVSESSRGMQQRATERK